MDRSWDSRLSERRVQEEGRGVEEVRETIDPKTRPWEHIISCLMDSVKSEQHSEKPC